jgi:hypothetical protein
VAKSEQPAPEDLQPPADPARTRPAPAPTPSLQVAPKPAVSKPGATVVVDVKPRAHQPPPRQPQRAPVPADHNARVAHRYDSHLPYQIWEELEMADELVSSSPPEEQARLRRYLDAASEEFNAGSAPMTLLELGRLHLQAGMAHAARDYLTRAVKLDDSSPEIHEALAETYDHLGNDGKARKHRELAKQALDR